MELIPNEEQMKALQAMAKAAHESGYYSKVGSEAGILSIMLLANELGIQPMQALSGGIWNINGKIEISARMMNMKIRQAGHKLEIKELTSEGCVIKGIRKDTGEEYVATFKKNDAERAMVLGKQIWKNYPREMYFARALSILARTLFPDVIGNCYVEHEIRGSDEAGTPSLTQLPETLPKVEEKGDDKTKQLAEKLNTNYESLEAFLTYAIGKYSFTNERYMQVMDSWIEKPEVIQGVYDEWIAKNPLKKEGS